MISDASAKEEFRNASGSDGVPIALDDVLCRLSGVAAACGLLVWGK